MDQAGVSAQLGPWRSRRRRHQNEVYPPETGGANWKFWVTYNHAEWVRGPWNPTGGYWTPGVPGLGYGNHQRRSEALRPPVQALLNGDRFSLSSGYHTTAYDFRTGLNLRCFNGFSIMSLHPATVEGNRRVQIDLGAAPDLAAGVPVPPDSSIAMTTDAWHTQLFSGWRAGSVRAAAF